MDDIGGTHNRTTNIDNNRVRSVPVVVFLAWLAGLTSA